MSAFNDGLLPVDFYCPRCGGVVGWSQKDGVFYCLAPGTCAWYSYEDEMEDY